MSERLSGSAVPNAEPQLDWFWTFFPCFLYVSYKAHKKRMTTWKIILTPTTKEPKICHALATTFAFNLKLCHIINMQENWFHQGFQMSQNFNSHLIVGIFVHHLPRHPGLFWNWNFLTCLNNDSQGETCQGNGISAFATNSTVKFHRIIVTSPETFPNLNYNATKELTGNIHYLDSPYKNETWNKSLILIVAGPWNSAA